MYIISKKMIFYILSMFSSSSFEEAYLNNHKTNDLESLHMEMYHYRMGIEV